MSFIPSSLRKIKSVVLMHDTDAESIKATLAAADVPLSEATCRNCSDPCEEGAWGKLLPPLSLPPPHS